MTPNRQTAGIVLIAVGFLGLLVSWELSGALSGVLGPIASLATVACLAVGVVLFGTAGAEEPTVESA